MKIKRYLWIELIAIICLACHTFAQPYYYYNNGTDSTVQIWRFNLQSGSSDSFYHHYGYFGGLITWDPIQRWIYLYGDVGGRDYPVFVMDALNSNNSAIHHRFPEQDTSQVIGQVHLEHQRLVDDPSHPVGKVQSFTRRRLPRLRGKKCS